MAELDLSNAIYLQFTHAVSCACSVRRVMLEDPFCCILIDSHSIQAACSMCHAGQKWWETFLGKPAWYNPERISIQYDYAVYV